MELGTSIQEPWRLRITLDEVIEELQTVSIKNYSVFLRNQECSDSIAHQVSSHVYPNGGAVMLSNVFSDERNG